MFTRLDAIKKVENNNCWQGCREVGNLVRSLVGMWRGTAAVETVGVPSKANQRITILPHHSPSKYVVKRNENNRCSNIFLLTQKMTSRKILIIKILMYTI